MIDLDRVLADVLRVWGQTGTGLSRLFASGAPPVWRSPFGPGPGSGFLGLPEGWRPLTPSPFGNPFSELVLSRWGRPPWGQAVFQARPEPATPERPQVVDAVGPQVAVVDSTPEGGGSELVVRYRLPPDVQGEERLDAARRTVQASLRHALPPLVGLAIAYAESGFNPRAVGDQGRSYGLLQAHTTLGMGQGYTPEQLMDPEFNLDLVLPAVARAYRESQGDEEERFRAAYLAINPNAAQVDQGPLQRALDAFRTLRALNARDERALSQAVTPSQVQRPARAAVRTLLQYLPDQYADEQVYQRWWRAACSAASLGAVLTAYGRPTTIRQALELLGPQGIDPDLGLLGADHLVRVLTSQGVPARLGDFSLDQVRQVVGEGRPVLMEAPPGSMYAPGHWYVVSDLDAEGRLLVNDSGGKYDGAWLAPADLARYWTGRAVVTG